jgi:hypothetical protein
MVGKGSDPLADARGSVQSAADARGSVQSAADARGSVQSAADARGSVQSAAWLVLGRLAYDVIEPK